MIASVSGAEFLHPSHHVPTGQSRHLQIDDGTIERLLGQCFQCRGSILANNDIVSASRQFDRHDLADERFVVHEQHTQFTARGSIKARLPTPFGEASRKVLRDSVVSVRFDIPCHGRWGLIADSHKAGNGG